MTLGWKGPLANARRKNAGLVELEEANTLCVKEGTWSPPAPGTSKLKGKKGREESCHCRNQFKQ